MSIHFLTKVITSRFPLPAVPAYCLDDNLFYQPYMPGLGINVVD